MNGSVLRRRCSTELPALVDEVVDLIAVALAEAESIDDLAVLDRSPVDELLPVPPGAREQLVGVGPSLRHFRSQINQESQHTQKPIHTVIHTVTDKAAKERFLGTYGSVSLSNKLRSVPGLAPARSDE